MREKKYFNGTMDILGALTAIFLAGLGLEGFLLPNGFLDGGVTGISMFVSEMTGFPLSVFIITINIPFLIIGFRNLNRNSIIKSVLTIIGLAVWLYVFDYPVVTNDKLLDSIFGGAFLGAGIGFAVRSGSVLDGTELMALIISRKASVSMGSVILAFNLVIFGFVGFFLGLERAMYSIITYIIASKSVDFILHGINEYTAVTIISAHSDKIKERVMKEFTIGMTVYKGRRGLSHVDVDILYCVITRFEIPKIMRIVKDVDEKAFVVTHIIDNTFGGLIKSRKDRFG
jgi:uncharacterized membrane-anchored protein YitT (DUF2179 family)